MTSCDKRVNHCIPDFLSAAAALQLMVAVSSMSNCHVIADVYCLVEFGLADAADVSYLEA